MRIRNNSTVRIFRDIENTFDGKDGAKQIVSRVKARVTLRQDSIISADGVIQNRDGSVILETREELMDGDYMQILEGPFKSIVHRYYISSIDHSLDIHGKKIYSKLFVARDKSREVPIGS